MTESSAHSVWVDVHSSVTSITDLLDACFAAWGPDDHKVSATTKKRLAVRALKGLEQGQELLKVLTTNLIELEEASKQWERNVVQASRSHMDLKQQLEHTSDDLQSLRDRIRQAEADRVAAQQELKQLQEQLAAADAQRAELNEANSQLKHELQEAKIGATEASCQLNDLRAHIDQLAEATNEAEAAAAAATGALSAAQQEAQKEQAARKRHEDAIARLTADNLIFMAKLRAAETAAAAATAERDQLVLALEEHKGPWMDEVHQGVERRVKEALERAEQLELQQEATAKQTSEQVAKLLQQQSDLEEELAAAHDKLADLQLQLATARQAEDAARLAAEEAQTLAADAQASADARMAELRVAQDSLKSMREECNERWMSERSARAQLAEQQSQLAALEEDMQKLRDSLESRTDDLMTQRAVNQQLMLKKEEVEWQLMAAIAKLNAEGTAHSVGSPVSPIQQPKSPLAAISTKADAAGQQPAAEISLGAAVPIFDSLADKLVLAPAESSMSPNSPTQQGVHSKTSHRPPAAAAAVDSPFVSTDLPHDTFSALTAAASGRARAGIRSQVPQTAAPAAALPAKGGCNSEAASEPQPKVSTTTTSRHECSSAAAKPSAFMAAAVTALATAQLTPSDADLAPSLSLPVPLIAAEALHHVGSTDSVPDMFSLPSLSYGLATLPPPELLVAAATGRLGSSGSLTLCAPSSGTPTAAGGIFSPTAAIHSKGVVLGATGGLMAAFSPLPKSPAHTIATGMGAVFPTCATASAVDAGHQLDQHCFETLLPDLLSKQQQPVDTGELVVAADRHEAASDQASSDQVDQISKAGAAVKASGVDMMWPGVSSKTAHGVAAVLGAADSAPIHPMFGSSPVSTPRQPLCQLLTAVGDATVNQHSPATRNEDVVDQPSAVAHPGGRMDQGVGQHGHSSQPQQQEKSDCSTTAASVGQQLHGILLNGLNSKPRSCTASPAPSVHGMSPSSSMKSVRFSFENLDQDVRNTTAGRMQHGELGDDEDCEYRTTAGSCRSHHRGGATEHVGHHHQDVLHSTRNKSANDLKPASCSSPRHRHREDGVLPSWVLQQRREQARVAAQAAAAAMRQGGAGAVVDMSLPKRPPVHPVFGAMAFSPEASKG